MKLLIYIPTWNRYKSLMEQLEILKAATRKDDFMVIVNDNDSTQKEYLAVKDFCNEQSNFEYRKNCTNLAANPNILNGFLFCNKAEYLRILSDDDLLNPGAVEKVIDLLTKYYPDFLYIIHNLEQTESFLRADQAWLVEHINDGMGLISLVIYKTSFIQPKIRAGYDNLLSCFPHLAILFESTKGKVATVCRVLRSEIFQPHDPLPIAESVWYKHSFFGFTHLANNLEENLKKSFFKSWWYANWFRVAKEMEYAPIQFAICRSLFFKHIRFFGIQWLMFLIAKPLVVLGLSLRSCCKKHLRLLKKTVSFAAIE